MNKKYASEKIENVSYRRILGGITLMSAIALLPGIAASAPPCAGLPSHADLTTALKAVAPDAGNNGGLATHMWATVVDRDGKVCAVTFTGNVRGDQWPGSRVISAQKANTANAFSLDVGTFTGVGLALSTANLFSAVQPGGSLFGLQHSNPVDTAVSYGDSSHDGGTANNYGKTNDPLNGQFVGGVNVFGGGLGLYNSDGTLIGAVGVSGDTSCADHNIAWRVRDRLGLDYVPAGVSPTGDDNIIYDTSVDPATGHTTSAAGFGHPACPFGEVAANAAIIVACPAGDGTTAGCP